MDTKLKKLSRLFPKPARVTAFVLACITAGSAIFGAVMTREREWVLQSDDSYGNIETSYLASENYRRQLRDMYEQLCILGVCELAQCDDDMNYIGNKYVQSDFMWYLDFNQYKYKKTDSGFLPVSDMFDYYVSYTRPVIEEVIADETVTDEETTYQQTALADIPTEPKTLYVTNLSADTIRDDMTEEERIEKLKKISSSYILRDDDVLSSDMTSSGTMLYYDYPAVEDGHLVEAGESYPNNFLPMGGWYHDSYGRYVYNFGNYEPIKFYTYPGNSEAGTTARRESIEKKVRSDEFWASKSYSDTQQITWWEEDGGYVTYIGDIFSQPDYQAYKGDTSGLTVFIAPKEGVLEKYGEEYAGVLHQYNVIKNVTTVMVVLALLLVLYLMTAAAVSGLTHEECGGLLAHIPFEVHLIVLLLLFFYILGNYYTGGYELARDLRELTNSSLPGNIFSFIWDCVLAAAGLHIGTHIIRTVFGRKTRQSFCTPKLAGRLAARYRETEFCKNRQHMPVGKKLKRRTLWTVAAAAVAFYAVVMLYEYGYSEDIPVMMGIAALVVFIITQTQNFMLSRDLSKLDRRIEALRQDKPFDEKVSAISDIKADIDMLDSISETVNEAVEERIKSERMKIELVANVSHDLKTPLTSIISYIDLLKKSDLDDEASAYVQILDKKSQKLKSIVADVFSLAKATSGIDVSMEELDFVMLFNQSLADADDKIKQSGKTVKVTVSEDSAPIVGDGAKLYRVFQNIIDNALKYSMDGSRIFLEIGRVGKNIVFTAKNTSSYPIDFTPEEITERFVRGDSSRTDGGSGLGLSIAKSFTEACGGRFDIVLDGDMFKASVTMPITEKNEPEKEII
ncbi:MAG: HAMP domain-containing histidine kinase [Ruminococcus sp.]|uniref:sensor histidine kinase n=1 Tax=Ruminococcus sp. TaxID=41978 RepID=UPI0025F484BB|nr:HAMP domain-containing sensor histidine kinase [Ruminococcus sp.]MBR0528467.1 HAMP domain-containing histidine kinase [Ruminococcus sp.]